MRSINLRKFLTWTALCGLVPVFGPAATSYTVAPSGNDDHPGTADAPFASIRKAADAAQPGDTVLVRAGTYRETVKVPRSGTEGEPITFTAYEGEEVVLSGGDPVTGWTRHDGDIWKATVSWDLGRGGAGNTLFVDGNLRFEARQFAEKDPLRLKNWGRIEDRALKSEYFTSDDIKGWGDGFWNGAMVRHHTHDWVLRNNRIADYASDTGKITFEKNQGVTSQKHLIGFYIYGTLKALDKPGEWFKDPASDTLYYQAEPGQDPNALAIEFKRRAHAFDVSGRDHIHILGMSFRGASVAMNGDSDHNLVGGNTFYAHDKAGHGRMSLPGFHNVFRDNEVSHTWDSVLVVSGRRQQVVNNYFHDVGYNGVTRVIAMSGEEHLVSHNTVRKFARSFLDGYPDRSEFAYNVFEDGANLSWDTGVFDGDRGRGNGGGCIVHHNVFRNSEAIGIYCAFYAGLDLVVHHNIVYDLGPFTHRSGQLQFLHYCHNTWIGDPPRGNVNAAGFAHESSFNNNIQLHTDNVASLGVEHQGNHNYVPADFLDYDGRDFRLAPGSGAIDAGILLPGINDSFSGDAPDAGALEHGQAMWKVGHDFEHPPRPVYAWKALPRTNLFEDGQLRAKPVGWTYIGSPVWFNGNTWNTVSTGLSKIGGHCFKLQPGDGLVRTFADLKPDTWYTVASETRLVDERIDAEKYDEVNGEVTAGRHRGEAFVQGLAEGEWLRYDDIDFGPAGKYDQLELSHTRPPGIHHNVEPATLEVRIDAPDGPVLGTLAYNDAVHDSWFAVQTDIPPVSGRHAVYLLGKGPGADVMRLAAVRLLNTNPAPDQQATIGVRTFDGSDVRTRIGKPFWGPRKEMLRFKTGPDATSAELFVQNDGAFDAYLDRLLVYEKEQLAASAPYDKQPFDGGVLLNLDGPVPVYGIRLTAAEDGTAPGGLRVAIGKRDHRRGSRAVWQRDYFVDADGLPAGETLVIKNSDTAFDGTSELQAMDGHAVLVRSLDGSDPGVAEVEVMVHDETDLVVSDGMVRRGDGFWEVAFPQIINVGEVTLPEVINTREQLQVTVWDRDPSSGGRIIWAKDVMPSARADRGDTLVVGGNEMGEDGVTRLASVLGRAVRIQPDRGAGPPDAVIHSASVVRPMDNVALRGMASQSSHLYKDVGLADTAVNSIVLPKGDFTSTLPEQNPWWQVALPEATRIDQVVLFNRVDCPERIGNFRVSAWDDDPADGGKELWGKDYAYAKGDLPAGGSLSINGDVEADGKRLDAFDRAQVVRVDMRGREILSLAEVQVWVSP